LSFEPLRGRARECSALRERQQRQVDVPALGDRDLHRVARLLGRVRERALQRRTELGGDRRLGGVARILAIESCDGGGPRRDPRGIRDAQVAVEGEADLDEHEDDRDEDREDERELDHRLPLVAPKRRDCPRARGTPTRRAFAPGSPSPSHRRMPPLPPGGRRAYGVVVVPPEPLFDFRTSMTLPRLPEIAFVNADHCASSATATATSVSTSAYSTNA